MAEDFPLDKEDDATIALGALVGEMDDFSEQYPDASPSQTQSALSDRMQGLLMTDRLPEYLERLRLQRDVLIADRTQKLMSEGILIADAERAAKDQIFAEIAVEMRKRITGKE